ncbi:MAG: cyclopropane-fatty-acyl-phospholipid synthase family protein [Pseudomonadota bacterium]
MTDKENITTAENTDIGNIRLTDRLSRFLLFRVLEKITVGCLTFSEGEEKHTFGNINSELQAHIRVYDYRTYASIAYKGSIGAGESYFKGMWDSENLTNVIRIFAVNMKVLDKMDDYLAIFTKPFYRLGAKSRKNTVNTAKQNIMMHYDLGNDMYETFLDESMMYSSGFYASPNHSLAEAQTEKLEKICQALGLQSEDHVVEIGSGWGGFAIHAAKNYGCRVTTTTISDAQFEYASKRIKAMGLEDRITILNKDYRLLEGHYDKLVSIEMIEAVGLEFYHQYFNKCSSLLKPNGKMLIQAITIADQRFERYRRSTDFIQKYIFPGGELPSLEYITRKVCSSSNMVIRKIDDFGTHYAQTLRDWRHRFLANKPKLIAKAFDDQFIRLWEFYLCYCEAAFMERTTSVVHVVMDKYQFTENPVS